MTTSKHMAGINTAALAAAAEGCDVLVSYADVARRPGVWAREILPRLQAGKYGQTILDSGAFTVISVKNFSVDVDAYGAFIAEFGHLFDVVVNLDDIAGDLETTQQNQRTLEGYAPEGCSILPVFHQGEPWTELDRYADAYAYIGVGFARREGGKMRYSEKQNRIWLAEFFQRLNGRAVVHGFAMTRFALVHGFPFASVDSTTWISEACSMNRRAATAADLTSKAGGLTGKAARAFDNLDRIAVLRFVANSYAHAGTEKWCAEAKGQAATVLARYGQELARVAYYGALGSTHARASQQAA